MKQFQINKNNIKKNLKKKIKFCTMKKNKEIKKKPN